ncbi:alpha/beta hydrolase [uncultured Schumannella sp.]|uniref:alpha/beta hydrolase n=1 Tax=uncultured Schumannella sp. TaxID=1195956 RepID=UPI0025FA2009|nr:alpha/beta hydrolase [uncultured Schumannella sp.]
MPLDPIIAALSKKQARARQKPETDPMRRREQAAAVDAAAYAEYALPAPTVRTAEVTVPVEGFPDVRVRLHFPETRGPHPAYLVFFGGAFRQGGIDYASNVGAYSQRTVDADVVTVAVDYVLAPENKWPAAVEQGYAVLGWLIANGAQYGIDTSRIAIGGQSSGGNIAACVCLVNRDRAGHPLRLQLLEVPSLDLTRGSIDVQPARELHIPVFLLKRGLVDVVRDYFDDYRRQGFEPYASPLRAPSLDGLPPAFILTAEYDVLRGDGEKYAAALRAAGVEASAVRYLGLSHESGGFTGALPGARRWALEVTSILRTLHDN